MGRLYSAPLDAISVTTDSDQDIWEMVCGSTYRAVLHEFALTSNSTTDERVRLRLVRRSTTGTGGSAITEVPLDGGNTRSNGTSVTALVTTPGTVGDIIAGWQWSQQDELLFLPTPECRIIVSESARLALHLNTAVASTRTWSGRVIFEEL